MYRPLFFALLLISSCRAPATGKTLHLYVSEQDHSLNQDIISLSRTGARRTGTELRVTPLGDLIETTKLQKGDSIVFVAYATEWNTKLSIEDLKPLLQRKDIKVGVWLLDKNQKPPLPEPLNEKTQEPHFDAVSSASSEHPAKKAGKAFLKQFY